MYEILLVSFLVVAIALVMLILIQHGKGADMGASFGTGASATVFGSTGSGNFLTRTTAVLAMLFFSIALALAFMTTHKNKGVEDTASKIEKSQKVIKAEKPKINTGIPSIDTEVTSDKLDIKSTETQPTEAKVEKTVEQVNQEADKATDKNQDSTPSDQ